MSFRGGLHPEINSLIHIKDEAREHMVAGRWLELLNCLHAINIEIQGKDQDKTLKQDVEKELRSQGKFKSDAAAARDMNGRQYLYREWYEKTIQLLWTKDYLINKKYGVETKRDTTFKTKPWTETDVDEVEI